MTVDPAAGPGALAMRSGAHDLASGGCERGMGCGQGEKLAVLYDGRFLVFAARTTP